MKKDSFSFKKSILAAVFGLFLVLPVMASENEISSVTISQARNSVSAYELSINSTKEVQYKTVIESDNAVYFDLKNSTVKEPIATFYEDAVDIDNVTVKQIDRNKVRIYVNGKYAKNTELIFENEILNSPKTITLNRPVSAYKPTNSLDLENEEDNQAWDDNSFNLGHLASSLLLSLKDSAMGIILAILAIFSVIMVIARSLASKLSFEKEPLIGLNSTRLNLDEVTKDEDNDLESVRKRNETLKLAQAQLTQAHQKYQQYLQDKYKNANFENKPKSIGVDPIKRGIALNQYQKSTQNPYPNQEVIRINQETENKVQNPLPQRAKKMDFTTPYVHRTELKNTKKDANMRFLESVTKIYEQSGRRDLADGLKNTVQKAKQTI